MSKPSKRKPQTKQASDACASTEDQVQEIIRLLNSRPYDWLLIDRQYDFECEGHIYASEEDLVGGLTDVLATNTQIIAIFHRERRLSEDDIRPMRQAAHENLGPVSRAHVDGLI